MENGANAGRYAVAWVAEGVFTTRSKRNKSQRNLQQGDLILLKNEDAPRSHWPLARILKTFPGSDGRVRVTEVKTPNGILMHPAAKLSLLEAPT